MRWNLNVTPRKFVRLWYKLRSMRELAAYLEEPLPNVRKAAKLLIKREEPGGRFTPDEAARLNDLAEYHWRRHLLDRMRKE